MVDCGSRAMSRRSALASDADMRLRRRLLPQRALAENLGRGGRIQRAGEEVALRILTFKRLELRQLLGRFDSLSGDLHVEVVRQLDDRADNLGVLRALVDPRDERAIDLHCVHGKSLKV